MTPCEKLGYQVGDEFVVTNPRAIQKHRKGVRVKLIRDDGSPCPWFEPVNEDDKDSRSEWCFKFDEVTPSSLILRKNGQPFATQASAQQQLSAKGLQGTHGVVRHAGGHALALKHEPKQDDDPITLRPGDYVSTADIADEDEYHAIARAFLNAGAGKGEYPDVGQMERLLFGWADNNKLWHSENKLLQSGRHLTPAQVLGAANATERTTGYAMSAVAESGPASEVVDTVADPITTLRQARTARDEAERDYQQALTDVREALGEGFCLEETFTIAAAQRLEADMSDPNNWKAGDVLECVEPGCDLTVGGEYTVENVLGPANVRLVCDDKDDYPLRMPKKFRFVRRP